MNSKLSAPVLASVLPFLMVTALAFAMVARADDATLDGSGLGRVRIGMPLAKIPVPLEEPIQRTAYNEAGSCFYVFARKAPRFAMMIEGEKLTRIDVADPGIRTSKGVAVGDPIQKIKDAYGAAAIEARDFYDEQLPEFTVTSPDRRYALRFSTREGRITSIIAGRASSVAYVEGCL